MMAYRAPDNERVSIFSEAERAREDRVISFCSLLKAITWPFQSVGYVFDTLKAQKEGHFLKNQARGCL